jgi:glucose/arabinose dehydrogenase
MRAKRRRPRRRTLALAVLAAIVVVAVGSVAAVAMARWVPTRPPGTPPTVSVEFRPVVSGLDEPVWIGDAGDGSDRLWVVERSGRVRAIEGRSLQPEPILDISDRVQSGGEQGLLGLAVPPDPADPSVYLTYTTPANEVVLARFERDPADPERIDPESGKVLLSVAQPSTQHNGGHIVFGPDGHLYVGIGDGTYLPEEDQHGSGQDPASRRGTILRLDVSPAARAADPERGYGIPTDNPLVAAGAPEVWMYGLRNPWRFSFDRATDDLWIGDVGEARIEEIDFEPAGGPGGRNYGWSIMEGTTCFDAWWCDQTGLTLPVDQYAHGDGDCAIVGGFVYRGADIPALDGWYVYGDYCSGLVWGMDGPSGGRVLLTDNDAFLSSFGESAAGELFALDVYDGLVRQLTVTQG